MNNLFINLRVMPMSIIALCDGVLCFEAKEPDAKFSMPVRIESAQLVDEFTKRFKIDLDEHGSYQVRHAFDFFAAGELLELEEFDSWGGGSSMRLGLKLYWIEHSSLVRGGA